jgi:cysteine desulfurase
MACGFNSRSRHMSFFRKKKKEIYFDYASSTPVSENVSNAMREIEQNCFANPSALHKKGVEASLCITNAQKEISQYIGASEREIVFTSGSTENIVTVLRGVVENALEKGVVNPHIILSEFEHSITIETAHELKKYGVEITWISVNEHGYISPEEVRSSLQENTVLVSIIYVQNELGTVQSISEISKIIRKFKKQHSRTSISSFPYLFTDAAQAFPYLPIDVKKLGVDFLSFGGSKIYGPRGIGILFIKEGVYVDPTIFSTGHQRKRRGGSPATPLIEGMRIACRDIKKNQEKEYDRLKEIQTYIREKLSLVNAVAYGDIENISPHILFFSMENMKSEVLLFELDAHGIYVATASACKVNHDEIVTPLHYLGVSEENRAGIRLSFGRETEKKDIDILIKALIEIKGKYKK